jgi:hypothetical protein
LFKLFYNGCVSVICHLDPSTYSMGEMTLNIVLQDIAIMEFETSGIMTKKGPAT